MKASRTAREHRKRRWQCHEHTCVQTHVPVYEERVFNHGILSWESLCTRDGDTFVHSNPSVHFSSSPSFPLFALSVYAEKLLASLFMFLLCPASQRFKEFQCDESTELIEIWNIVATWRLENVSTEPHSPILKIRVDARLERKQRYDERRRDTTRNDTTRKWQNSRDVANFVRGGRTFEAPYRHDRAKRISFYEAVSFVCEISGGRSVSFLSRFLPLHFQYLRHPSYQPSLSPHIHRSFKGS